MKILYLMLCCLMFSQLQAQEITKEDYKKSYEEAMSQVKTLQHDLYKTDQNVRIGIHWYQVIRVEVFQLRNENAVFRKRLQVVRDYLESKGIYLSDLDGRVYDYNKNPLYLEQIARQKVEEQLKIEKVQRDLDKVVNERKIQELNRDYYLLNQECIKYKKQVEEDQRYFKMLQQRGFVN